MERLYAVQDEAQDWLVPPVHQPESWPRNVSWSQDGLIAYCSPSGRHSGKDNLALSYPIFVCSFNFAESRVTLETPHCTPIRFLQWAPLSTGRLLLSADDTTICIWQFGCHPIDVLPFHSPVLVAWLSADEPRIPAAAWQGGLDSRFTEAARSSPRPQLDGCKDGFLAVSATGHVIIAAQQSADSSFMTARYHIAPTGATAAEISFLSIRPIVAIVGTYANSVSVYELSREDLEGKKAPLLTINSSCISRLVLEPTVRVLAIRANPYYPAQFLLVTSDVFDPAPRLELWEVVTDVLQTTPSFTRLAGPATQLEASTVEFVAPGLVAVASRTGTLTILSRDLVPVAQEKAAGLFTACFLSYLRLLIAQCTHSPNSACLAALDTSGVLSVWRLPATNSPPIANRFILSSVLGADPTDLQVALLAGPLQDISELHALLMQPLSPALKGYYNFHVDAFRSSLARLLAGPEAQVPAQSRLSLAFVLDAMRACMIKPFSLPSGIDIWNSVPPASTEGLYKPPPPNSQLYIVDHAALPTLYPLTEWVLDFAVYFLKSAHFAALSQRDAGPIASPAPTVDLPIPPTSIEAYFVLYSRSLPRISPAIIMLFDDDTRHLLLELLVLCHNVREQFSQRKLVPAKHSSYGIPMLKALHELLITFYTKSRLASPPTLETLPQILQTLYTEIASVTLPAVLDSPELDPTRIFATLDLVPPLLPFVTTLSSPSIEGDVAMLPASDAPGRESARDVVSRSPLSRDERRQRICTRCGRVALEAADGKLAGVAEAPWPARWAYCCPLCGGRWIVFQS